MARKFFDPRLLTHHPQGQRCMDTCLANGWLPSSGDVIRLVRLWDEVDQGRRSDTGLDKFRLDFVKWMVEHGRISDEINQPNKSKEGFRPNPERR